MGGGANRNRVRKEKGSTRPPSLEAQKHKSNKN